MLKEREIFQSMTKHCVTHPMNESHAIYKLRCGPEAFELVKQEEVGITHEARAT